MRSARADWLHVLDKPMISSRRAEWVEFAAAARLPLSSDVAETARVGGLISCSAAIAEHYSLAAVYVDKILKEAKPADLPFEQPTSYELIVNLKTAKSLGLPMPQMLARQVTQAVA
jgi:putative tryptophan/tyrosine transport system substrate-binding protein